MADGSGRPAVGVAFLFAFPEETRCAILRGGDIRHKHLPGTDLGAVRIVGGMQFVQPARQLAAVVRGVVIDEVKDEPQLETGVGASDPHALAVAQRGGLLNVIMRVAVEHRPNLVMRGEGVFGFREPFAKPSRSARSTARSATVIGGPTGKVLISIKPYRRIRFSASK